MRNWLTYNGKSTKDFGIYISGLNSYNAPARDYDTISIAGRNGDLTIDNGRYENIDISYPAFIYDDFNNNVEGFRNFLLSQIGYKRLEDTYHPDEFRMAIVKGGFKSSVQDTLDAGEFEIKFTCKPQRFLKSGEIPIEITASTSINNPTYFASEPLIRVYGYGTFHVGDYSATITQHDYTYMDIDCSMMDAYNGTNNLNNKLSLGSNGFIKIESGAHGITIDDNTVTKIIIYPRWYIL